MKEEIWLSKDSFPDYENSILFVLITFCADMKRARLEKNGFRVAHLNDINWFYENFLFFFKGFIELFLLFIIFGKKYCREARFSMFEEINETNRGNWTIKSWQKIVWFAIISISSYSHSLKNFFFSKPSQLPHKMHLKSKKCNCSFVFLLDLNCTRVTISKLPTFISNVTLYMSFGTELVGGLLHVLTVYLFCFQKSYGSC